MRMAFIWSLVVLLLTVVTSPGVAQEAEAIRKELEVMRKNFEKMQSDYQKSMDAMAERLRRLEAEGAARAVAPAAGTVVQTAPVAGQIITAQTPPSTMDIIRPREPFKLSTQRGPGQFLFDMGIAGDLVGNITQNNVDRADAGTFRERENRFFPREVELSLFGQIDPYARGEVRIEAGQEGADAEIGLALAEAHLTLLTLPFNTQAKLGRMRARYGWANQFHAHDLPWVDVPNVYRRYFGEEGLLENGLEASWIPGLPFFLEALVGVFNGDNEEAFGRGKIKTPLITGRLRTFFELGDEHGLQLGASVASGLTAGRESHTLPGVDVRYKYRPTGWTHPLLTFGGEAIWSLREQKFDALQLVDTDGDDIPDTEVFVGFRTRDRTRFGAYLYGEVQPFKRWAGGVRYDYTESLIAGTENAIQPYVTFWPSEFLRFRLGYKHTGRTQDQGFSTESTARTFGEVFFQATFVLGAHPAHPF
jgi:hypothetical protein